MGLSMQVSRLRPSALMRPLGAMGLIVVLVCFVPGSGTAVASPPVETVFASGSTLFGPSNGLIQLGGAAYFDVGVTDMSPIASVYYTVTPETRAYCPPPAINPCPRMGKLDATLTSIGYIAGWWSTLAVPNNSYDVKVWVEDSSGAAPYNIAVHNETVNNISPNTSVIIPSSGATQSGTSALLDSTPSFGVTTVQYEVSGGPNSLRNQVVATTTAPSIWGWLALWNTTTVPNGTYTLQSVAYYPGGVSGTSPPITISVAN